MDDDWELLPDHKSKSSFFTEECGSNGHGAAGGGNDPDQLFLLATKLVVINSDHFGRPSSHHLPPRCECILLPPQDPAAELKGTGGGTPAELEAGELASEVTEILIFGAEEEEEAVKSPAGAGVKGVDQDEVVLVEAAAAAQGEDEEGISKIGFNVGNLRLNGVGALCSLGVAAATFCIFLFGGKQQQKGQDHKIQLQMYAGDERIQRVVQQASRLNSAGRQSWEAHRRHGRAYHLAGTSYHGF